MPGIGGALAPRPKAAAAKKTEPVDEAQVPLLLLPPISSHFNWLEDRMLSKYFVPVDRCKTMDELKSVLSHEGGAVLMFQVFDRSTLLKQLDFFEPLQPRIKAGLLRLICIIDKLDRQAERLLKKTGVQQIVHTSTTQKAVELKINRELGFAKFARKTDSTILTANVKSAKALKVYSDCWLTNEGKTLKKKGWWEMQIRGPLPDMGQWIPTVDPKTRSKVWKWIPNPDSPLAKRRDGYWEFRGKEPKYKDGWWIFISKNPALVFVTQKKVVASKVDTNDVGDLVIAKDSGQARDNLKAMLDAKNTRPASNTPAISPTEASKYFSPVTNSRQFAKFIQEARDTGATITVWTKDAPDKADAKIIDIKLEEGLFMVAVKKKKHREAIQNSLMGMKNRIAYLNLRLRISNVFFNCEFVGFNDDHLWFKAPEKVFEAQRRYHLRLPVMESEGLHAVFEDPKNGDEYLTKELIDLGAGGSAFFLTPDEVGEYEEGQVLNKFTFELMGRKIQTPAKIQYIKEVKLPGEDAFRVRVGLSFVKLKPIDVQYITLFVLKGTQEYFTAYY